jgi:hypothetical protein
MKKDTPAPQDAATGDVKMSEPEKEGMTAGSEIEDSKLYFNLDDMMKNCVTPGINILKPVIFNLHAACAKEERPLLDDKQLNEFYKKHFGI